MEKLQARKNNKKNRNSTIIHKSQYVKTIVLPYLVPFVLSSSPARIWEKSFREFDFKCVHDWKYLWNDWKAYGKYLSGSIFGNKADCKWIE